MLKENFLNESNVMVANRLYYYDNTERDTVKSPVYLFKRHSIYNDFKLFPFYELDTNSITQLPHKLLLSSLRVKKSKSHEVMRLEYLKTNKQKHTQYHSLHCGRKQAGKLAAA